MNKKLFIAAFVISFLAMIVSFISPNGLMKVNERPSYISVLDLAEGIKNRESIHLIDLRSTNEFEEFHLPTAQNIPKEKLVTELHDKNGRIVIYSDENIVLHDLWLSFDEKMKKQSAILYGGVHDWHSQLLYPKIPTSANQKDSLLVEKIVSLCKFYGGRIELVTEKHLLEYYHLDMEKVIHVKTHSSGSLKRKGC